MAEQHAEQQPLAPIPRREGGQREPGGQVPVAGAQGPNGERPDQIPVAGPQPTDGQQPVPDIVGQQPGQPPDHPEDEPIAGAQPPGENGDHPTPAITAPPVDGGDHPQPDGDTGVHPPGTDLAPTPNQPPGQHGGTPPTVRPPEGPTQGGGVEPEHPEHPPVGPIQPGGETPEEPPIGASPLPPGEGEQRPPVAPTLPEGQPEAEEEDLIGAIVPASGQYSKLAMKAGTQFQMDRLRTGKIHQRAWRHMNEYGGIYRSAQELRADMLDSGNAFVSMDMTRQILHDINGKRATEDEQRAAIARIKAEFKTGLTAESGRFLLAEGPVKDAIYAELIQRVEPGAADPITTAAEMNTALIEFAQKHRGETDTRFKAFTDLITQKGDVLLRGDKLPDVFAGADVFLDFAQKSAEKIRTHEKTWDQIPVLIANPEWAQASSMNKSWVDTAVEFTQRYRPLSLFLNPATVAAGLSIGFYLGTRGATSGIKKLGGPVGLVLGTAAGTLFARMRAGTEGRRDVAQFRATQEFSGQHDEALPQPAKQPSKFGRFVAEHFPSLLMKYAKFEHAMQTKLEATKYDVATAEELIDGGGMILNRSTIRDSISSLESQLSDPDAAKKAQARDILISRAGEILSRIDFVTDDNRSKRKGLIDFKSPQEREEKLKQLHAAVDEIANRLAAAAGGSDANYQGVRAEIREATQKWREGLWDDIDLKDAKEKAYIATKRNHATWAALGTSLGFGILSHEVGQIVGDVVQQHGNVIAGLGEYGGKYASAWHDTLAHNPAAVANDLVFGSSPDMVPAGGGTTIDVPNTHAHVTLPPGWHAAIDQNQMNHIQLTGPNGQTYNEIFDPNTHHITGDHLPNNLHLENTLQITLPSETQLDGRVVVDQQTGVAIRLPNGLDPVQGGANLENGTLQVIDRAHNGAILTFTRGSVNGHEVLQTTVPGTNQLLIAEVQLPPSATEIAKMQADWLASHPHDILQSGSFNIVDHNNFTGWNAATGQTAGYELYGHWGDGWNLANVHSLADFDHMRDINQGWFNKAGSLSYGAIITKGDIHEQIFKSGIESRAQAFWNVIHPGQKMPSDYTLPPGLDKLLVPEQDEVINHVMTVSGVNMISPDHVGCIVDLKGGGQLILPPKVDAHGILAAELPGWLQTSQGTPNPDLIENVRWGFAADNTDHLKDFSALLTDKSNAVFHQVASENQWQPSLATATLARVTPASASGSLTLTEYVPGEWQAPFIPIAMARRHVPRMTAPPNRSQPATSDTTDHHEPPPQGSSDPASPTTPPEAPVGGQRQPERPVRQQPQTPEQDQLEAAIPLTPEEQNDADWLARRRNPRPMQEYINALRDNPVSRHNNRYYLRHVPEEIDIPQDHASVIMREPLFTRFSDQEPPTINPRYDYYAFYRYDRQNPNFYRFLQAQAVFGATTGIADMPNLPDWATLAVVAASEKQQKKLVKALSEFAVDFYNGDPELIWQWWSAQNDVTKDVLTRMNHYGSDLSRPLLPEAVQLIPYPDDHDEFMRVQKARLTSLGQKVRHDNQEHDEMALIDWQELRLLTWGLNTKEVMRLAGWHEATAQSRDADQGNDILSGVRRRLQPIGRYIRRTINALVPPDPATQETQPLAQVQPENRQARTLSQEATAPVNAIKREEQYIHPVLAELLPSDVVWKEFPNFHGLVYEETHPAEPQIEESSRQDAEAAVLSDNQAHVFEREVYIPDGSQILLSLAEFHNLAGAGDFIRDNVLADLRSEHPTKYLVFDSDIFQVGNPESVRLFNLALALRHEYGDHVIIKGSQDIEGRLFAQTPNDYYKTIRDYSGYYEIDDSALDMNMSDMRPEISYRLTSPEIGLTEQISGQPGLEDFIAQEIRSLISDKTWDDAKKHEFVDRLSTDFGIADGETQQRIWWNIIAPLHIDGEVKLFPNLEEVDYLLGQLPVGVQEVQADESTIKLPVTA